MVTDATSQLSLGATLGSNNTGELSAIGEALMWLRDEAPPGAAAIHYDSEPLGRRATVESRAGGMRPTSCLAGTRRTRTWSWRAGYESSMLRCRWRVRTMRGRLFSLSWRLGVVPGTELAFGLSFTGQTRCMSVLGATT